MLLFPLIVQMGLCKPLLMGEEVLALTSSEPRRIVNMNCFFLLPLIHEWARIQQEPKGNNGATKAQLPR